MGLSKQKDIQYSKLLIVRLRYIYRNLSKYLEIFIRPLHNRYCKCQEDMCLFLRVWRVSQSEATSLEAEINFPLEKKHRQNS